MKFALPFSNPFPWQKPPVGARIDWSHPITRGLICCDIFNLNTGRKSFDLTLYQNEGTFNGTINWERGAIYQDNLGYVRYPCFIKQHASQWTILVSFVQEIRNPESQGGDSIIVQYEDGVGAGRSIIYIDDCSPTYKLGCYIDGSEHLSNTMIEIQIHYIAGLVKDGNNFKWFLNGKLDGIFTATADSADGNIRLGKHKSANFGFQGWIHFFMWWNRPLTAQEIYFLYLYPYAFFLWPGLEWWASEAVVTMIIFDSLNLTDLNFLNKFPAITKDSISLIDKTLINKQLRVKDFLTVTDIIKAFVIKIIYDSINLLDSIRSFLLKRIADLLSISETISVDKEIKIHEVLNLLEKLTLNKQLKVFDLTSLFENIFVDKTLFIKDTLTLSEIVNIIVSKIIIDSISLVDKLLVDKQPIIKDILSFTDKNLVNKNLKLSDSIILSDIQLTDKELKILDLLISSESIFIDKSFSIKDEISLTEFVSVITYILKQVVDSLNLEDLVKTDKSLIKIDDFVELTEELKIDKSIILQDIFSLIDIAEVVSKIIPEITSPDVKFTVTPYGEYAPDDTVGVFAQLLDEEGKAVNNANIKLTLYNLNGNPVTNYEDLDMDYIADSKGLYKLSFRAPSTPGIYVYGVIATWDSKKAFASGVINVSNRYKPPRFGFVI